VLLLKRRLGRNGGGGGGVVGSESLSCCQAENEVLAVTAAHYQGRKWCLLLALCSPERGLCKGEESQVYPAGGQYDFSGPTPPPAHGSLKRD